MRKSIRTEFNTWLHSYRILLVLVSIVFIFSFCLYGSYRTFFLINRSLLEIEKTAIEGGTRDEFMASFTKQGIGWGPGGDQLILEFKEAQSQLHAINPEHALSYCMEMGYFFFPLLLTIFGALVIKTDFSNGTMRLRIAREGRKNYFWGKQIMLYTISSICVIVGMMADYCISFLISEYIGRKTVFGMFDLNGKDYVNMGNSFIQVLFFAFYIFLFLEVGFCIALITKSILIPIGAVFVSFYIFPMYRYTPQNAIANIVTKMCDFQGIIHYSCVEISTRAVVLIISLLLVIPMVIAIPVYQFRSAYR